MDPNAEELLLAAIGIAEAAPAKRSQSTYAALVPWSRIERLRAALDAAGIEWHWTGDT